MLALSDTSQLHPRRSQVRPRGRRETSARPRPSPRPSYKKQSLIPFCPFVLVPAVSSQAVPQLSPRALLNNRDVSPFHERCPCRFPGCLIPAAALTSGALFSSSPGRCGWAVTAPAFRGDCDSCRQLFGGLPNKNPSRPARRRSSLWMRWRSLQMLTAFPAGIARAPAGESSPICLFSVRIGVLKRLDFLETFWLPGRLRAGVPAGIRRCSPALRALAAGQRRGL